MKKSRGNFASFPKARIMPVRVIDEAKINRRILESNSKWL